MKSFKDQSFEKCIEASLVNLKELREIAWNGVPHAYRAITWKLLSGYIPTNKLRQAACLQRRREEYKRSVKQLYQHKNSVRSAHDQRILDQVSKDVPRTAPQSRLFSNDRILNSVERILFLWAIRHPASSYVQGINDLVTPLFVVFLDEHYFGRDSTTIVDSVTDEVLLKVEADCYGCLSNILSGIQDHYTPDQPGIHRMIFKLEELVKLVDNDLFIHFNRIGLKFEWFAFKWMNCYLIREFPLSCIIRMWDTYLSEDKEGYDEFHVYVCAALLEKYSKILKGMEFEGVFEFIQGLPTSNWDYSDMDVLLSQAFVLKSLYEGNYVQSNNHTKEKSTKIKVISVIPMTSKNPILDIQ